MSLDSGAVYHARRLGTRLARAEGEGSSHTKGCALGSLGAGLGPPEALLPEGSSPWGSAPSAARGALPMTPLAALTQAGCCLVILHGG